MEFIIGGTFVILALIGFGWMLYRKGYYDGIEAHQIWQYEKDLAEEKDWEAIANFNSNYEELPSLLKRQAD